MEEYKPKMEGNEGLNIPSSESIEKKESELTPERLVWRFVDIIQQRDCANKRYEKRKDEVKSLKDSLTLDSTDEDKELLSIKEREMLSIQNEVYELDRKASQRFGPISEETKQKYLNPENAESLNNLKEEENEKEINENIEAQLEKENIKKIFSEENREVEAVIERFENLLNEFGEKHSYEALNAVTIVTPELKQLFTDSNEAGDRKPEAEIQFNLKKLSPEEQEVYAIRMAAKKDCMEMMEVLKILKLEKNIPTEKYNELYLKYKKPSRALGIVDKDNNVDHTR